MTDKKTEILRCGKILFTEQGFKKTNVSQITEMAGVATGTFYLYYPSKESLFMEIYMEENKKLKRAIMEDVDMDDEPMQVIQELMQRNMEGMAATPHPAGVVQHGGIRQDRGKISRTERPGEGRFHVCKFS